MFCLAAIGPVACLALLVQHYWERLFNGSSVVPHWRVAPWICRGLIVPIVFWCGGNVGLGPYFPPLIPEIALAKSAGAGWWFTFSREVVPGIFVIGFFWTCISFLFLLAAVARNAAPRNEFLWLAGVITVVLLPLGLAGIWFAGLASAGAFLLIWLIPLVHCTMGMACHQPPTPSYSQAEAQMKFGKYKAAEWTILQELEKKEDDFEGWMRLAELYAGHFGDMAEAARTIASLCEQPHLSPLQVSLAYHRLADWYLKRDDPVAARLALREIERKLPGSHLAKMSRLRQDRIPKSREELLEEKAPRKMRLPALSEELDKSGTKAHLPREEALNLANEMVKRLKADPNNTVARERLAVVFAEELAKPDLGIDQLELLLQMGDQSESKRAAWLSWKAAWHLRYRHDIAAARKALEELVRDHGNSAEAFAAQRRLHLMEMDQSNAEEQKAALI